jgi:hypothetical protein
MNSASEQNLQRQSSEPSYSSHEDEELHTAAVMTSSGVPIQCQYCPGRSFRRSRLRSADVKEILMTKYPVRCLRCSQRQMVSFTVAGIAVPSHVKQRKARSVQAEAKHWPEPMKQSLRGKRMGGAVAEEAKDAGVEQQEKRTT